AVPRRAHPAPARTRGAVRRRGGRERRPRHAPPPLTLEHDPAGGKRERRRRGTAAPPPRRRRRGPDATRPLGARVGTSRGRSVRFGSERYPPAATLRSLRTC